MPDTRRPTDAEHATTTRVVNLAAGQWTCLPGTRIEIYMVLGRPCALVSKPDGDWDLSGVEGILLARLIFLDGHTSLPWPISNCRSQQ